MDTMPGSVGTATNESSQSAVSWPAVISGTFVALAVALVLVTLGAGFGVASISPWPNSGVAATTFAITTGIGLIIVHWLASASGGYITGRLRAKWVGVHTHEVFFRDTAHGFLTWAVATVIGGMVLTSAASSLIGGSAHVASSLVGSAASGVGQAVAQSGASVSGYDVDSLFRSDRPDQGATPEISNTEATRILASGLATGDVPAADRSYLAQMVAARTGLTQPDAQKRVDGVIASEKAAVAKAKEAADAARKAASELAIFTALAMLIGAFIASAAAAYGGSLRDEH